jgi:hypothetical protein
MLQWDEQNRARSGKHDFRVFRAVDGKREYRVFHDPESGGSQKRPWILVIREPGEDREHTHVFHGEYPTADEAKKAADEWRGPPPK